MLPSIHITACYAFFPLGEEQLSQMQNGLRVFGQERDMRGLVLLASEGINGTVSGNADAIREWKAHLTMLFGEIVFKDSEAEKTVFRRWSVKLKPEIVGLKRPDLQPEGRHKHLSPKEWQKVLEHEDVVMIDARNDYETEIGIFRNAIDPKIQTFQEFPDAVRSMNLPKEKKVLLYCTGGIRCEKALLAMEEEGYENVYQLEGGILAYLQQFPDRDFTGECFVFDKRVSLDQRLRPSQIYGLCPHCGDPGALETQCPACGVTKKVCVTCAKELPGRACSKRCAGEMRQKTASKA